MVETSAVAGLAACAAAEAVAQDGVTGCDVIIDGSYCWIHYAELDLIFGLESCDFHCRQCCVHCCKT